MQNEGTFLFSENSDGVFTLNQIINAEIIPRFNQLSEIIAPGKEELEELEMLKEIMLNYLFF
ncbi:hypothetical protein MYP_3018 [Sporocytophaga myxococcoides]|uniref:Uncharacterized protein n=1 Tax=Sporocytophaga myxococcoides TaxID=153721 RepID=A0A098LH71_9BACT|nr:hypothetical protein [Sporocytophaga myxococcoides]GAL85789.1 hypothetical protein MYP_3018 [Sporocytophaga myxococcoides]